MAVVHLCSKMEGGFRSPPAVIPFWEQIIPQVSSVTPFSSTHSVLFLSSFSPITTVPPFLVYTPQLLWMRLCHRIRTNILLCISSICYTHGLCETAKIRINFFTFLFFLYYVGFLSSVIIMRKFQLLCDVKLWQ